tara:strand:- start:826 stop:1323 length:498 start_codon:yes stop_codon:yes gene_type:complete
MATYKYRAGYRPALKDPQIVGDKLQELRDKNNGLTASIIIEEAKHKTSVLHGAFEWDDSKAAHEWRLHSARHLMRSVEIVSTKEEGGTRSLPAFVFVKTDDGPRYETLAVVQSDEELRRQVLERAEKEFDQWAKRYEEYEEFLSVFKAFDKTRKILRQKHEAIAN